ADMTNGCRVHSKWSARSGLGALAVLLHFIISPIWHTSCFTDKTSCVATKKANSGRPQSLAVQLPFGVSTACQGRSHVVAQPVGPQFVGPEKGQATRQRCRQGRCGCRKASLFRDADCAATERQLR